MDENEETRLDTEEECKAPAAQHLSETKRPTTGPKSRWALWAELSKKND